MNYNNIEILFAEDSKEDAALTIRALKRSGLSNNILHVKDGVEAIDFLFCREMYASRDFNRNPKLILLDIKMPKVTGIEVLQMIKADEQLKSIPVVILTSSNEHPDIKRCYALGANSYIVKPVDSDNFFRAIKELGLYWFITNKLP
jgi:CheY-like chemotaxis protein